MNDDTVFLFDVDNTLLDNDRFAVDLKARIESGFGAKENARYWSIYQHRRDTLGYADYLGTLQAFRVGLDDHPDMLALSAWLLDYPFEGLLYDDALAAVAMARSMGRAAILSDGDIVFQPRKVVRAGLSAAFGGEVMIFLHKEQSLDALQRRYPAEHYVMVDDKPNLLAAMKQVLGDRLVTVFVRQGHYASQADMAAIEPAPDRQIERIGDLLACEPSFFCHARSTPARVAATHITEAP